MAEYKNGVTPFGNVPVTKDAVAAEVKTGRAVFVDEDLYSKDEDYKAKVDKCIYEGFHRVSGDGSSSGSGSCAPLKCNVVKDGETGVFRLDHTCEEILDVYPNVCVVDTLLDEDHRFFVYPILRIDLVNDVSDHMAFYCYAPLHGKELLFTGDSLDSYPFYSALA